MFSVQQKRRIADAVQRILRETCHPELPTGEISFHLHVDGAEDWSWADIRNNGAVGVPNPPVYGWGPRQLPPPTPAPGMRRVYLDQPSQMAECGGPCWEAQDPRYCVCGALWRDVPAVDAKPQPHGGRLIKSWKEPSPPSEP
jgi:hypothetical protein